MMEVMKIMGTSFKRSHACTATLSAPSPAAGHHQAMPLLETPRHSQASLGQRWPAAGLGALSVAMHSWDLLKEIAIIFITFIILWPQVNLYTGQEATVRTRYGTTDWFQLGKEYIKAVYCHPAYLTSMQSKS